MNGSTILHFITDEKMTLITVFRIWRHQYTTSSYRARSETVAR